MKRKKPLTIEVAWCKLAGRLGNVLIGRCSYIIEVL